MLSSRLRIHVLLLCAVAYLHGDCQTTPDGTLPKDPAALMSLGLARNGLGATDLKPWHIRGTFVLYDDNGKPDDKGVYEEWWAASGRYKLSFSSSKFTQTDYAKGGELYREGVQDWSPTAEAIRSSLIEPLPAVPLSDFVLKMSDAAAGKTKMSCVSLTYPLRPNPEVARTYFPTYCFDSMAPVLLVSSAGSNLQVMYTKIGVLEGHYVALELHAMSETKPRFDVTLNVGETMNQVPDSFPDVPSDARRVDLTKISFPASAAPYGGVQLLIKAAPTYPQLAKDGHIQGRVVIKATIETDGHVDNLRVSDGPSSLHQAALDAVRHWVYRPFRVMGEARPVGIEINVIFMMG